MPWVPLQLRGEAAGHEGAALAGRRAREQREERHVLVRVRVRGVGLGVGLGLGVKCWG